MYPKCTWLTTPKSAWPRYSKPGDSCWGAGGAGVLHLYSHVTGHPGMCRRGGPGFLARHPHGGSARSSFCLGMPHRAQVRAASRWWCTLHTSRDMGLRGVLQGMEEHPGWQGGPGHWHRLGTECVVLCGMTFGVAVRAQ